MQKKVPSKMNIFSTLNQVEIRKPIFSFIVEIKFLNNLILILSVLAQIYFLFEIPFTPNYRSI